MWTTDIKIFFIIWEMFKYLEFILVYMDNLEHKIKHFNSSFFGNTQPTVYWIPIVSGIFTLLYANFADMNQTYEREPLHIESPIVGNYEEL